MSNALATLAVVIENDGPDLIDAHRAELRAGLVGPGRQPFTREIAVATTEPYIPDTPGAN